ncbi:MAG: alpha/beta fold hydrolase, partial [Bacteroidales bacterium]|nr:alpha/beta fold hydrolase [Bacteroidales bacterium]
EEIKNCKIGYRTVGKLNADKSNAILWPTWFGGTSEEIAKPSFIASFIDTTQYYIIAVDALTNGISSSPSNTVGFPKTSIQDMVNSQYNLLVHHLKITHLYAVMGISLGGIQTYEWIVAYPDFMEKAIPIVGTPKLSFYDLLVWQTQIEIIEEAGSNKEDISFAMKRVYDIFNINKFSPAFYNAKYKPENINDFKSNQYTQMMDYRDYLAGVKSMLNHDIYKITNSNPEAIKDIIKADVLIVISQKDHLVNPMNSIAFSKLLNCELIELTGDCGHIAPWCETSEIKKALTPFLD